MQNLTAKLKGLLPQAPKSPEELQEVASTAASETYELEALEADREVAVEAAKAPTTAAIPRAQARAPE